MKTYKQIKKDFKKQISRNPFLYYPYETLLKNFKNRQKCSSCGIEFWHQENKKYCGDSDCNSQKKNMVPIPIQLSKLIKSYNNYYLSKGYTLRPCQKLFCKWGPIKFVNAGITSYQLAYRFSNTPIKNINHQFCIRFKDLDEKTDRHFTGFIMTGHHHFSPNNSSWVKDAFTNLLQYIKLLGIKTADMYIHQDSWSDGIYSGASLEFFINGIEICNQVYTTHHYDLKTDKFQVLKKPFLDMGLGFERLYALLNGGMSNITGNYPLIAYDRIRTYVMCINSGILPHKRGPGHNVRKLLRSYFSYVGINALTKYDKITQVVIDQLFTFGISLDSLTIKQARDIFKKQYSLWIYK